MLALARLSTDEWEANCYSDPNACYRFLKILEQYSLYKQGLIKPTVLPLVNPPTTILEADELYSNTWIVYYLSRFDSKDVKRRPLTLKQLKEIVITFFTMLGTCICNDNLTLLDRGKPRNEARVRDAQKAKEWMIKQWDDQSISHSTMVAKFYLAIAKGEVTLENEYKPSVGKTEGTFERWAKQADPWPEDIRRRRPKTKNISKSETD